MSKKNSSAKKNPVQKSASPKLVASPPATLGTKRYCSHCAIKFYDFGKAEIICPKCERVIDPKAEPSLRLKNAVKKPAPVARSAEPFDDDTDVVIDTAGDSEDSSEGSELTQEVEIEEDDNE